MEQRLSLITLGVADLARSRRFYCDGLGFRASSAGTDEVVFFDMGGVVLALYPRASLSADAGVSEVAPSTARPGGFGGFSLAHNVASREEVDAALEVARRAGAPRVKAAEEASWGGYVGYFEDPDGHIWEVAHNPHWKLSESGALVLPP